MDHRCKGRLYSLQISAKALLRATHRLAGSRWPKEATNVYHNLAKAVSRSTAAKRDDGDQIDQALKKTLMANGETAAPASVSSLGQVEWEHLNRVLAGCGNNITQASRFLGIDRRSLQRKLQEYPPSP